MGSLVIIASNNLLCFSQNTRDVIHRHCGDLKNSDAKGCNVALIVDGKTLKYALTCDLRRDFLETMHSMPCRDLLSCLTNTKG